jgi:hypothetical protein
MMRIPPRRLCLVDSNETPTTMAERLAWGGTILIMPRSARMVLPKPVSGGVQHV